MPLVKGQTNIVQNPEFDKRILPSGAVDKDGHFIKRSMTSLYRGRIETAGQFNGRTYRLQFLFNPTSFTHSGSVDATSNLQAALQNPDFVGQSAGFMQVQQNVNFSLLFDRTYETWDHSPNSELRKWGVLTDIKAMYMLFGMYENLQTDSSSSTGFVVNSGLLDGADADQITPTGPMQYRPVWAIFGPVTKYYGVITNFDVTYTHFTQMMVPNRCAVNFSMQLIPNTDPIIAQQKAKKSFDKRAAHNSGLVQQHRSPGLDKYGNIY